MDDYCRWMPGSPFRVPEWRWLRAEYLNETGRRMDRRIDDQWVKHARDALRGRGRAGTPAATVWAAREVWLGDPNRRGEVEARLLAGNGDAAVVGRTALSEQVVAAYSEVFFDVRPAMAGGAIDWLLSEAVGWSPLGGFTRPLPQAAWRLAAVAGGPNFADLVIAATTGRPLPPAFLDAGGVNEVRVREMVRLWVAAMAAVRPAAFAPVIREYRRFRTTDARPHGRKVRVEPRVQAMESVLMSRSVSGALGELSTTVGHRGRDDPAGVSEPPDGITCGPGEERAASRPKAVPPASGRAGRSTRRTQAA
jgi:hypothetical protein